MSKRDREAVSHGLGDLFTSESDLLGSVIRSDRKRGGRSLEPEPPPPPSPPPPSAGAAPPAGEQKHEGRPATQPESNIVIMQYDKHSDFDDGIEAERQEIRHASNEAGNAVSTEYAPQASKPGGTPADFAARRVESLPYARAERVQVSQRATRQAGNRRDTEAGSEVPQNRSRQALPAESTKVRMRAASGVGGSRTRQAASQVEEFDRESLVSERVGEAESLAETQTTTVTLRIPRSLNDWLDEYTHLSWPEKVRKQELVTEALQLLFARRGRPGEPVVPTALLGEEE